MELDAPEEVANQRNPVELQREYSPTWRCRCEKGGQSVRQKTLAHAGSWLPEELIKIEI